VRANLWFDGGRRAPGLLFIGGLVALVAWIFSDDDKEKKPETVSTSAAPECPASRVPPVSGWNTTEDRPIPANSGGKPNVPPAQSVRTSATVPVMSAPATPKIPAFNPAAMIPAIKNPPQIPLPPPKKIITREHIATIFNNGTRKLNRKAAVAALKALGFRKTAAYEALAINGRFAPWLQFAPDGIITWKS
jgi:hypothetical protein